MVDGGDSLDAEWTATILQSFDDAMEVWGQPDPDWHPSDYIGFETLRDLLTPHAHAGNVRCQYALATIVYLDLCEEDETEEEYLSRHDEAGCCAAATPWWVAAANQGYWAAVDSHIVMGVGPEAERARTVASEVEKDYVELVT
jgi:hypothetical protein